jgi:hypothetical protein
MSLLDELTAKTWQAIDLSALGERPAVRPTLGAGGGLGLVYPGRRHVFSGPPESAKTLAAYAIGLRHVQDEEGLVVLLDFEMGEWDARDRLVELGATPDDLRRMPYYGPETGITDASRTAILELGLTLALIDAAAGAYAVEDLDDQKRRDAELWANLWVRPFWKAGVATITIDHVTKNTETRGKFAIGSERKIGGVDVHLGFETITELSRGGTGLYKITTHRDRHGYLPRGKAGELEVRSDPETHALTCTFRQPETAQAGEDWRPTVLMDRVLDYLAVQSEPLTRNAIARDVRGKKEYILQAIDFLLLEGKVDELGPRKLIAVRKRRGG